MPEYPKPRVIVGDHDANRRKLIADVLRTEFNAEVHACETFDELLGKFGEETDGEPWRVVIFSDGLVENNQYRKVYPPRYARTLRSKNLSVTLFCVHSGQAPACFSAAGENETDDPKPNGTLIEVAPDWSMDKQREALIAGFSQTLIADTIQALRRLPTPPRAVVNETDLALVEQVRAIHPDRSFEGGKRILECLTVRFFDCDEVEINKLSQGFSGATVFRIVPNKAGSKQQEYALKLGRWDSEWKIASEVRGQKLAKDTLGVAHYTRHIPDLKTPRVPAIPSDPELQNAASFGNWLALCYDFLGGARFGKFIDLETALSSGPMDLKERLKGTYIGDKSVDAARHKVLATILRWLGRSWYQNSERSDREPKHLWDAADAPAKEYCRLPPYALTGQMKQLVLSFLDGQGEALGKRLLSATWEQDRKAIWKLLTQKGSKTGFPKLDRELPVILSPSHGDLNANNVLLWLEQADFPFLIDFPSFQQLGHAVQDLARLEVEIKLSLMDRQLVDSRLAPMAYDYTYTQLDVWKKLEDHMLSVPVPASSRSWQPGTKTKNLNLTLMLLHEVRANAREVQKQLRGRCATPEFFDEYLPSLLYHTCRAIGYPSLPIFKRLLAVYSVGRILEQLA